MSGIPHIPVSTTSEGLHTPADEWASQTASALNPEATKPAQTVNPTTGEIISKNPKYRHPEKDVLTSSGSPNATTSTASTPGFPGAYHEDRNVAQDQHFSLSDTATKVSHSVQTTAQKAGETAVHYLPQSVVNTVSAYMPASLSPNSSTIRASSHDIPHLRSLPSSELKGTQPGEHVSGVGSLPGNLSEISVGKLPDERSEVNQDAPSKAIAPGDTKSVGGIVAGAAAGVGATAAGVYESVKHAVSGHEKTPTQPGSDQIKLPPGTQYTERKSQMLHGAGAHKDDEHEPLHPVRPFESLPIEEFPSTSRGGVGSLPGTTDESGVAVLPDERKERKAGGGWGTGGAVIGAAAGVGATVGGVYEAVKSRVSGQPAGADAGTTLPSSEKPSTSPVGVGSLPGDIHEQGAAQLPDEMDRKHQLGITGATDPGVGTHPRVHDFAEQDLPSHESGMSREPVGGVGSLPGGRGEQGVGLLPDEREKEEPAGDIVEEKRTGEEFDDRRGRALAAGVAGAGVAGAGAAAAKEKGKGRPGVGETRKSEGEIPKSREAATGLKERRLSGGHGGTIGGDLTPRDEFGKKKDQKGEEEQKGKEDEAMAAGVGAGVAAGVAAVAGERALGEEESKKVPGGNGETVHGEKTGEKAAKDPKPQQVSILYDLVDNLVAQTLVQRGTTREPESIAQRRFVEYSDNGQWRREDESSCGNDRRDRYVARGELIANLGRVTLTPRSHALGGEGAHLGVMNLGGETYRTGEGVDLPEQEGGDTGYHPAELHPLTEEYGKAAKDEQDTGVGQTTGREGVSEKAHEMPKGEEKKGQSEKAKKVGFMEKMKGEAKMLLGKVEGGKKGEEKIEEGRRIKTGEGPSPSAAKA